MEKKSEEENQNQGTREPPEGAIGGAIGEAIGREP